MILCQISDLHIKREGALAYGRVDTAGALRRCLARIVGLRPQPDAVVVTGDLVDLGGADEYAHLRQLLGALPMPCYLLVGNHDHRESLIAAFPEHAHLAAGAGFVQYAVDVGPLRLIALDTQDPPRGSGRLCARRLAWLEGELERAAGRPVVVAMHHPPFATGIAHMDAIGLPADDCARLAQLIARHPNVERVLCGHLHRAIQRRFAGTLASTVPSPAHQVAFDIAPDAPSAYRLEPPAFQLHAWRAGEGLVSHLVMVDDYPGPYPFFHPDGELID